jgi:prepilin-type N-terminal cleavage/methylation domain-containing protein/prepilin-type processing-associated H-X9-DG protein
MSKRPLPARHGFTLVELLVVIGIIALLISILLPSLNRARDQANRIKCASNLRNQGIAMTMYVNQYRKYPGHAALGLGPAAVWPTRLRAFLNKDHGVFLCPSQPDGFQWKKYTTNGTAGVAASGFGYEPTEVLLNVHNVAFSYGYNDWGAGPVTNGAGQKGLGGDVDQAAVRELGAGRVKVASDMIAITDNTADRSWDYNIDPYQADQWPGKIHSKGANVLFCDGHVVWYPQNQLVFSTQPKVGVNANSDAGRRLSRMWNNDNQP